MRIFRLIEVIALALFGVPSLLSASKVSDVATCSVASSTGTLEFGAGAGFWPLLGAQPEFARLGLIVCKLRAPATGLSVDLSGHGPMSIGFAQVPSGVNANLPPSNLAEAWARFGVPADARDRQYEELVRQLRASKSLNAILSTPMTSSGELWVLYAASLKTSRLTKTEADLVFSTSSTEAEKLFTVSLDPSMSQWERIVDAFPGTAMTFFTNMLGVFVGAALSLIFFRQQQRIAADMDEIKQFAIVKRDHAQAFREFWHGAYEDFKTASDDVAKVRLVRSALQEKGLYGILPRRKRAELDAICENGSASRRGQPSRGKRVDQLLRESFGDLMIDS